MNAPAAGQEQEPRANHATSSCSAAKPVSHLLRRLARGTRIAASVAPSTPSPASTHQNQAGRSSSSSDAAAFARAPGAVGDTSTGSVGSGDDKVSDGDSDGGADVCSGLSDSAGGSDLLGDPDWDSDAVGGVDSVGDSLVGRDGDLLGSRVGLGSDAVIDPVIDAVGEGTSIDPSPPHEVRSTTSSSPADLSLPHGSALFGW